MNDKKNDNKGSTSRRLIQENRKLPTLDLKIPMPKTKPPKEATSAEQDDATQKR